MEGDIYQWQEEKRAKKRNNVKGGREDDKPSHEIKVNQVMPSFSDGQQQNDFARYQHQPSNGSASSTPLLTCLCGPQGTHTCLVDCPSYQRAQDVKQRWCLLTGSGACFRCLEFGHRATECPDGCCTKEGCDRRHHPSLHVGSSRTIPKNYEHPSSNGYQG